jgi:hypothetical protein
MYPMPPAPAGRPATQLGGTPSWAPAGNAIHGAASGSVHGSSAGAVPQQRVFGTVYGRTGGFPEMTMPVTMNSMENSGSLTGHILAQGWSDTPQPRRRGGTKVVVAMLLVLLGLVGMSLLFLLTAGDAFTRLFRGLF